MRLPIWAGVATLAVSLTLYPLFDGGAWLWGSLGAVLAVTAAGVLSSRLTLPGWAAPLLGLVALGVYLTAVYTGEKAWALLVPTKESALALVKLLGAGFADIQRYAAPVPDEPPIAMLTTAGVGLIAIVVDLFVTRLRRAALAGLPLLALFTVPAAVLPDPIGWPAFILGALGFTSLLIADGRERVGHWGRAVLVRRSRATEAGVQEAADTRGLRLSGKRIGFTAIALAVLLPALLPTLEPDPLFGFGVGGSGKGRGSSISIPDQVADLKGRLQLPENSTVLSYTSSDDTPRYLRIYSLDVFDGRRWTMNPLKGRPENRVDQGPLPPPPGLAASMKTTRIETDIQVSEDITPLQFLPLPYPPQLVRAEGDWRADVDSLMVFSSGDLAGGLNYQVVSTEPDPTADQLDAAPKTADPAVSERYLKLPELPPQVRQLAQRVVKDSKSPYEAAVSLQRFFTTTGGFTYSLTTEGHDTEALTNFLEQTRAGYCEQFASAMAVLARSIGIPARVAIGYTGGTKIEGRWEVRTHDSHAWPELYFEGVGWLAFEPTPAGSAGQGTARVPDYTLPRPAETTPSSDPSTSAAESGDTPSGAPNSRDRLRELDPEGVYTGPITPVETTPLWVVIALSVAGLLVILLIPAMVRLVIRNRRVRALGWKVSGPSDDVTARARTVDTSVAAAWAELDDVLCDYGMARLPSETPRALARRLTQQHEFGAEPAAAIATIASAVERLLFARDPGEIAPMRKELRTVRRALAATVSRTRRVRATLLPPSTLRRIRGMGEGILDGFDRLENIRLWNVRRWNARFGNRAARKDA
ncbi:transglutaminaseTgpA domain-containing protein [Nonomuraea sp. NPDC059194]|uniref:transglutaminase family protein n=1 Tax=Nonomuraea sp. NPDC059194 TaxID=3346764 RepID=UPI0036875302